MVYINGADTGCRSACTIQSWGGQLAMRNCDVMHHYYVEEVQHQTRKSPGPFYGHERSLASEI
jgi:hypothetical protein